jgi:hypothetical protein
MVTEIELFESPYLTLLDFFLVGFDEERSLQKKGGYIRQVAYLHFGCCCQLKEM